jgi:hypothetical protein
MIFCGKRCTLRDFVSALNWTHHRPHWSALGSPFLDAKTPFGIALIMTARRQFFGTNDGDFPDSCIMSQIHVSTK